MAKFGLPTYPIADGMLLGNREPDELQWLIDHGVIQTDIRTYKKITKISDTDYRLTKVRDEQEQIICGANSLQTLIEMQDLNISMWYWYPHYN